MSDKNFHLLRRTIFILFLCLASFKMEAQGGAAGFKNDQNFFFVYNNNQISKLEYIKIDTFWTGRDYISYIDNFGNFKLYYNSKLYTIFPIRPSSIKVSNYLMAYTQGGQLGVFNGKSSKKVETFTQGDYKLGDSIIAYVDNFGLLKAYVFDTVITLMRWGNEPFDVGDNIMAYSYENSGFNVLYNKRITELENYLPMNFKVARNIIAYNDYMGNFKVFDHGNIYTLEIYETPNYEVANEIVTYFNNIGEWMVFYNGEKSKLLTTKPKKQYLKRNVLAYIDFANRFYVFYKGKLTQLENYEPARVEIWDDMLVYTDFYGKLWGFVNGEKVPISDNIVLGWELQKECVVYYDLTPAAKTVWHKGKNYIYDPTIDVFNRK